ncbi:MAG: hypothetical protein RBS07_17270 [Lentimicrobium sp.]|nr:hypothetical protein [Lentimicrobium sp.]
MIRFKQEALPYQKQSMTLLFYGFMIILLLYIPVSNEKIAVVNGFFTS